jgi:ribonuclease E
MLETERFDRESDNHNNEGAGPAAGVTPEPAQAAGPAGSAEPADSGSQEAAGSGRRLFRRGRRAATRPAGPPADNPGRSGEAHSGVPVAGAPPVAAPPVPAPSAPAPGEQAAPGSSAPATGVPAQASPPTTVTFTAPPEAASTAPSRAPREARPAESGTSPTAEARTPAPAQAPEVPAAPVPAFQPPLVIFQPPDISSSGAHRPAEGGASSSEADAPEQGRPSAAGEQDEDGAAGSSPAKRRRRGGRGHAKGRGAADTAAAEDIDPEAQDDEDDRARSDAGGAAAGGSSPDGDADGAEDAEGSEATGRRRRRRRRSGPAADAEALGSDDPPNTVVHVRSPRASAEDSSDVRGVKGSTRLEAKRQRRREGRESGRRRPPIITESEFLARREAVERLMVVRQHGDRTQIAVLEDGILVEHYVDRASHQSYVGNVYLGRVQNVLPSMEAAFVDIGKGRNAVLYAGEVNFDASGLEGESKRIESALKSGQPILVQATKDPIGHKGARLTSQVSLPGRYLVYVPGASMTGISRKLPDTERTRLKQILKQVMPEDAGVIVRTAAEGATEEELSHDVARLAAQWEAIERKAKSATAPELLYSEPDLTIRVVRDIFNEDFSKLVIASDGDWDMVDEYVRYVAPSLAERLERWTSDADVFAAYRIDEQIAKALERKVWLPSGGSLVIDATEAMTVIDVNTGKFTGQGGNLEQTVTRNNLEAAEEIVRQLRVRDIGGIIVIDFIDMVLESNRDLVLRRLLECLARDRTKHQVAEVTSLGLVQMTRKRVGSGLLEAFSVPCDCCNGRGVIVSLDPVDHAPLPSSDRPARDGGRGSGSRGGTSRRAGRSSPADDAAAAQSGDGTETSAAPEPSEPAGDEPAERIPGEDAAARADGPGGDTPASAVGEAVTGSAASEGASSRRAPGGRRRRASVRAAGPPDSAGALGTDGSPVAVEAPGTADAPDAVAADGAPGADGQGGDGAAPDSAAQDSAAPDGAVPEGAVTEREAGQGGETGSDGAGPGGTREAQTTAG